ncbi:uncharacterized protein LOC135429755 isoform X4 [Drosophila montana]|uniref:uncharacterized protein LOC135429755 isoform X4 n=1 Tax=Drosophila montana TaxID=40370 RepID=UPI00313B1DDA
MSSSSMSRTSIIWESAMFRECLPRLIRLIATAHHAQKTSRISKHTHKHKTPFSQKTNTNPAVKSAVKSVKESSRGVKTAYKKWRDNGSHNHNPNNHFHFGLGSPQHSDRPDGSSTLYGRKVTHRSAPSSPVCSKRELNLNGHQMEQHMLQLPGQQQQQRRAPVPLAMSSSSSQIPANGYALGAPLNANFDHIVGASPAVSSASSICSSEMNLSQELQNHPLFKMPAVDRSLKPNAEHHSTRSRNGPPPARPPPPAQQPASYYNHPYAPNCNSANVSSTHPLVDSKPPRHTSTPTKPRQVASTDSSFDSPPDVQSPPIPPRRQCSANAVVAATAAAVSAGINRLERNCWQDESSDSLRCSSNTSSSASASTSASSSSSSSCSSAASFVTAASRFSQLNVSSPLSSDSAPIPTPRAKRESPRSSNSSGNAQPRPEDSMNDLISLDDSNNTSFDLEDFDPLNQNARPLPPLGRNLNSNHKSKSSTLPVGVNSSLISQANNSVNNPLYPYFAPKHMATVAAVTSRVAPPPQIQRSSGGGLTVKPPDDDFELLRKYGLDQFSLNGATATAGGASNAKPALTAGAGAGKGMNNWTTFD